MKEFIKLIEGLNEAPVNDIDYFYSNDPKVKPSFVKKDAAYLSDKNNLATIKKHLFKIPIPINLYFVNQMTDVNKEFDTKVLGEWTIVDRSYIKDLFNIDVDEDPSVLTVFINSNEGEYRMPLTPWIIAHRIIHAIDTNDKNAIDKIRSFVREIQYIIPTLPDGVVDPLTPLDIDSLMHAIGTMKSARDERLSDVGEFVAECLTQFLIQGEIKFNKVPYKIPAKYGLRFQERYKQKTGKDLSSHTINIFEPQIIDRELQYWKTETERRFFNILISLLGKIILL